MFTFLLILIALCTIECTPPKCFYYGEEDFKQISCGNITSIMQLQDEIEGNLHEMFGSVKDSIKAVELHYSELSNFTITALRFLPSLEEIKIANSNIESLSIEEASLTTNESNGLQLRKIVLQGNHIKTIEPKSLYGFSNLRELNLRENGITEINVSLSPDNEVATIYLLHLSQLDLSYNNISRIRKNSFPFPSISDLNLNANQIVDIESNAFLNIKHSFKLTLANNRLTKINKDTFSGSMVQVLNLGFNRIEIIEQGAFSNLPNLQYLNLENNQIGNIYANTFPAPALKDLILSHNNISTIEPYAFNGTENLRNLAVKNNNNQLTTIQANTFSGSGVQFLDLANNSITNVEPYAFYDSRRVSILNLENNMITKIYKNSFSSTTGVLLLGGNPVTFIEPGFFDSFSGLQAITLQHIRFGNIPPIPKLLRLFGLFDSGLTGIQSTDLKDSLILETTKSDRNILLAPGLETLHLAGNKIETITPYTFRNLKRLYKLDLTANKLTAITKDIFAESAITKLKLNDNRIEFIEPGSFFGLNLTDLHLNNNRLTEIHCVTFSGCTIEKLSLQNNGIKKIERNAFADIKNLHELILTSNGITTVTKDTFASPTLQFLHLGGNEVVKSLVPDFERTPNMIYFDVASTVQCPTDMSISYNSPIYFGFCLK